MEQSCMTPITMTMYWCYTDANFTR